MSFNPQSFVKNTAKTVADRIIGDAVSKATNGLPLSLLSSAASTAESLFNAGASFESISALTSQKTDSLINSGSDVYYALAGKDPARASAAEIKSRRTGGGSEDTSFYLNNINPTTAINNKRARDAEVIMGAII